MINQELKEKYKKLNQEELNEQFIASCQNNDLDIVQFLLTSLELTEHADIHAENDRGFRNACLYGRLEVVKYLLTSAELNEHVDIHAENDRGFIWACAQGQLKVVKYLLTSAELTEHADIHAENDWGFIWAGRFGYLEVVKCLIIDMNIEKTTYIETYLNENKDNKYKKYVQQAIELFNTRDLHYQLNENIKDNKEKVKKMKI